MNLATSTSVFGENRGWLWGPHGTEPGTNPSIDIDASQLPAGTTSIPSGAVMTLDSASGKYKLSTPGTAPVQGGLLFDTVTVSNGQVTSPNAALLVHGFVDAARLPIAAGQPGGLDAEARTALVAEGINFNTYGRKDS